jgi:transcriptional regulator with XRE-family HTH domain
VLPAWRQDPRRAGRRLRVVREVARLTQLGLAAASGVTHETICQLELGRRAPQPTSLRKLARALQVAPTRSATRWRQASPHPHKRQATSRSGLKRPERDSVSASASEDACQALNTCA